MYTQIVFDKKSQTKMTTGIVLCLCLFAAVLCVAAEDTVPIISQESHINPDGSYQWSYQTGDGSKQQQVGQLKEVSYIQMFCFY